ncbi:tyrosine-type recombinase/integrase [Pandoraea communis]|uniref:tyrosine-type recombinase/integrase n=1 Tax=Pandoraea communis TaxID=2508297 RepID=UPI0025A61F42|nr:site-specific integrase [Pandoraea communis]MDM8356547.1 tyrosine-type recombinase/integrase [Pandoraea communis]
MPNLSQHVTPLFAGAAPSATGELHIPPRSKRGITATTDIEAIREWLRVFQARPQTLRTYQKEAERFYFWLSQIRKISLADFRLDDVFEYAAFLESPPLELRRAKGKRRVPGEFRPFSSAGLSRRSRQHALTVIASLFGWLHSAHWIKVNAFVLVRIETLYERKEVKARQTQRQSLSNATITPRDEAEIARARKAARRSVEKSFRFALAADVLDALEARANQAIIDGSANRESAERALFVVRFLMTTGLRRDEIALAKMSDIQQSANSRSGVPIWTLRVFGKGSKERDISLIESARAALERYKRSLGEPVSTYGNEAPLVRPLSASRDANRHVSANTIYTIIREALTYATTALNLQPTDEDYHTLQDASPHWFRHAFTTFQSDLGAPLAHLQKQLGHKNINTTGKYIDQDREKQYEILSTLRI